MMMITAIAGAVVLRFGWDKRRAPSHRIFVAVGWALLGFAAIIAARAGGDRAVAISVVFSICLFCGFLAYGAYHAATDRSTSRVAKSAPIAPKTDHLSLREAAKRAGAFILAGPVSAAAALWASLLVYKACIVAGLGEADRLVATFFAAPIIWAGFSTYSLMDARLVRRAAVLIGVLILSASYAAFVAG